MSYTQDPLCQAWKPRGTAACGGSGSRQPRPPQVYGSNGFGTITAPGNDPFVITVGATKANGSSYFAAETKASYSSKGPTTYDHVVKPDLVAPGNAIVSLAARGATLESAYGSDLVTGTDGQAGYFKLSGTSMATPVVAGAAALMLQEHNTLTPDQVKARLMKTASKMGLFSTSSYVPHLLMRFWILMTYSRSAPGCSMCKRPANKRSCARNSGVAAISLCEL